MIVRARVGQRDAQEDREKQAPAHRLGLGAPLRGHPRPDQRDRRLDERVLEGEADVAGGAAAAQPQVADDGDVLEPPHRRTAAVTT